MTIERLKTVLAVAACLVTIMGGTITGTLFFVRFEDRIKVLEAQAEECKTHHTEKLG